MSSNGFIDEYQEHAWSFAKLSISHREEQRIDETLSLIPQDCFSILDLGCGDGRITNRLISRYKPLVGLDSSKEALQEVKAAKILGKIESLPFPDKSFDLVLCCEVLEHLPLRIYPKALNELQRVSAKYLMVTVPNSENLEKSAIICPACKCRFSPWRHVRSFDSNKLKGLFAQFSLQNIKACHTEKAYPESLLRAAQFIRLLPRTSPNIFPTMSLCPQCGYSPPQVANKTTEPPIAKSKNTFLISIVSPLVRTVVTKRECGGWLIAVYRRMCES